MKIRTIYVVVRVGCIECGVDSDVVFTSARKKTADDWNKKNPWDSWTEQGGEGYQKVFEVKIKL